MVVLYTPIPHRYGVIHIDPIATVESFPYPDILEAAKEMTPKKYLVFVRKDVGFPWPNRPWYLFDVIPIAPCVPPDDGTMRPEMCVPIFPNTSHPSGRMHIHTNPEFPYDNCYYWSLAEKLTVRIRAKPERFDDDHATKLEPRQLITLWDLVGPDLASEEPDEDAQPDNDPGSLKHSYNRSDTRSNTPSGRDHEQDVSREEMPRDELATSGRETTRSERSPVTAAVEPGTEASDGAVSVHSRRSIESEHSAASEFRAIVRTGIFEGPYEDKEVFPLVDLWVELADNLKQNDIPKPDDLYKEYEAVVSLVAEAKRRREQEERLEALRCQVAETGYVYESEGDRALLEKEESSSLQIKRKRKWNV